MSLWVDKHRPKSIDQLTYHNDMSNHLKRIANSDNFPHVLFYGPPGAGKKTRIAAVLREIYGPTVEKLKAEQHQYVTSLNQKMIFTVVSSSFHIQLSSNNLGIYDYAIMQDIIKNIAQTQQLDTKAKCQYKVIVIDQADQLNAHAQAALCRTVKKYTPSLRFIFCSSSLGKIIEPVRSHCLLMRVARPQVEQAVKVLLDVANKQNFCLSKSLAIKIVQKEERNMRSSLLLLQNLVIQYGDLSTVTQIDDLDWEISICKMAEIMIQEPIPASLEVIKQHIYDLIIKYIEPSIILKRLTFVLLRKAEDPIKRVIIEKAADHVS